MDIVNKNSHLLTSKIKDANCMIWQSDNTDQFNYKYNELACLLQSKTKQRCKANAQFMILQKIRKETLINLQTTLGDTQLLQSHISQPKQLKTDILSMLPVFALKFPVFQNFKPPSYCEMIAMKNFPDNNPMPHWNRLVNFVCDYNFKLIKAQQKNRKEMKKLIGRLWTKAIDEGNIEVQIVI
eukprot:963315_1